MSQTGGNPDQFFQAGNSVWKENDALYILFDAIPEIQLVESLEGLFYCLRVTTTKGTDAIQLPDQKE